MKMNDESVPINVARPYFEAQTISLSLSKALKLKSRLAGRLSKTTETIKLYNSNTKDNETLDVVELDNVRGRLVEALVILKTEIFKANAGIYSKIIELGEKKSEIDFLNSLNTRSGTQPYGSVNIVYVAAITMADVQRRVKLLEKEIDAIQDDVDVYNAAPNRIRVSGSILELAS
jgi:hypothetical protein